ncbi:MAG: hypothetical protein ABEJ04_01635 [Halobacteriaceae archaeon]
MPDRAVAPVVGKLLEVGIVLAYVALVTAALYGHAVPTYRADAANALGDRTLAAAAGEVEAAVPSVAGAADVSVTVAVDLPRTIGGEPYVVRADGRSLVLVHPTVDGRQRLALPAGVVTVRGEWHSTAPTAVRVSGSRDELVVELEEGT